MMRWPIVAARWQSPLPRWAPWLPWRQWPATVEFGAPEPMAFEVLRAELLAIVQAGEGFADEPASRRAELLRLIAAAPDLARLLAPALLLD